MSLPQVVNPYEPFVGLTGTGLNGGHLYIGVDGMDPEANPQDCFWDAAGTILAAQPIDVVGGYPMRLGSPARIFTASTYSMRLRDRTGAQVFYLASAAGGAGIGSGGYATRTAAAVANVSASLQTSGFNTMGFFTAGDGGGAQYKYAVVQASGPGKFQSADGAWWELASEIVFVEMFGLRSTTSGADTTYALTNRAALAEAVAWLKARTQPTNTANRGKNRPTLCIGAGTFVIDTGATNVIDFQGFALQGAGKNATALIYEGAGALFDLGAFSANPGSLFGGAAQGYYFADLSIVKPSGCSMAAHGTRTGHGIRDNGSGTGVVERVRIAGLQYGYNSPYGGDFNRSEDFEAEYCDCPLYLGPGSQQNQHDHLTVYFCNDGPVLDRAGNAVFYEPILNSCKQANFVLESLGATSTRQLATFPPSGTNYQSMFVLDAPWFEGNAGSSGDDSVPTYHFEVRVPVAPDAYRDVVIRNPYIVSGAATKRTTGFLGKTGAGSSLQRLAVQQPVFQGEMDYWAAGDFGKSYIYDLRVTTGYTAPGLIAPGGAMNFYDQLDGVARRTPLPFDDQVTDTAGTNGVRQRFDVNGIVSWAFLNAGTWLQRMGIDVQNRRLVLDDPESANPIQFTRASAQPTTGSWGAGSLVLNTAPTVAAGKVQLGWQRLTSGSGHVAGVDWSPLFCTIT